MRQNRHRSLEELGPMAATVLAAVISRLRREGRLLDQTVGLAEPIERPPLAQLRTLSQTV